MWLYAGSRGRVPLHALALEAPWLWLASLICHFGAVLCNAMACHVMHCPCRLAAHTCLMYVVHAVHAHRFHQVVSAAMWWAVFCGGMGREGAGVNLVSERVAALQIVQLQAGHVGPSMFVQK